MSNRNLKYVDFNDYTKLLDKVNQDIFKTDSISLNTTTLSTENLCQIIPEISEYNNCNRHSLVEATDKLYNAVKRLTELEDKKNKKEMRDRMGELHFLCNTTKNHVMEIDSKVKILSENLNNLRNLFHNYLEKDNALDVDKSVQREFVETVNMLTELCSTFEDKQELICENSNVNWNELIKVMHSIADERKTEIKTISTVVREMKNVRKALDGDLNKQHKDALDSFLE